MRNDTHKYNSLPRNGSQHTLDSSSSIVAGKLLALVTHRLLLNSIAGIFHVL